MLNSEKFKCDSCGALLLSATSTCSTCSTELGKEEKQITLPIKTNQLSNFLRVILIVITLLITIVLVAVLVTSEKFNFPMVYLIAVFIAMLAILGPYWPSEENIKTWEGDSSATNTKSVCLKFISYFLRFFCTIISINFIYSLFTGSIYINLVSRHSNSPLNQVSFDEQPLIFSIAFIFSGYVFVESVIWIWSRLKTGLRETILLYFTAFYISYWGVNYLFDTKESQPPLGFCAEKNRVLTHEELIIAALEDSYKYNAVKIDDSTTTAHEFYKKYPFCCGDGPPGASYPRRSVLTGKLYIEDPGYVVVSLYFPTSDEVMSTPLRNNRDENVLLDKEANFTKRNYSVSNCGGVDSQSTEHLNIKDTPFGNESMKSAAMEVYERRRDGLDWRIRSRESDWQYYEHRYDR